MRIFYLVVPLTGVWFLLAYLVPSPIGLLLPAFPWLALVVAALALVLVYLLWRSTGGPRWSKVYRNTVVGGVVLGLVFAGLVGLTATLAFGCPFLPPGSSLSQVSSSGWEKVPTSAWQDGGKPVVFFYGATWCPYCSASSWALWKAMQGFGVVSGTSLDYSAAGDAAGPSTPEVVLSGATLAPRSGHGPAIAFEVAEDQSGVEGTVPGTASCAQQAFVSAYSNGIPYIVINGQYVHRGTLVAPLALANWSAGVHGGAAYVQSQVAAENASSGSPWLPVMDQTYWTMAFIAVALGQPVSTLANDYVWTSATKSAVTTDVALIG